MMAATANINEDGGYAAFEKRGRISAVSHFKKKQTITFNLSKRLAQSWGQDREHIFENNKDISCINLCDSVAFLYLLRQGGCKKMQDYNPCKLRNRYMRITGVHLHTRTVENYIRVLAAFNLCRIEDGTLYFSKIRSNSKHRNFKIEFSSNDSIKSIGRKIAEHVVSAPMRAIGYVLELQRRLHDPKSLKELKDARHRARRLSFDIEQFQNDGIAYSTIAIRLNVSRSYVVQIIKNCVKKGIIAKVKRCISTICEKASRRLYNINKFLTSIDDYYTYYRYNSITDVLRLYVVKSNCYEYNPYNQEALTYNI